VTLGHKSSSWRRIFIGSHSLPPLWFTISVLQNQRKMNHEVAIEIKRKEWEGKITLEWFASLVGSCFPRVAVSPCLPWPWGFFFWKRRTRGREMMEVLRMDLQSTRGAILLAVRVHQEWWLVGVHWWEYQTAGVFPWMRRVFSLNSVHDSRMRIFCGFYAKEQEFCAYSARWKVPKCVRDSENSYAQIKEIITRQIRKIKFHLYCQNSITPSTN
jgi:hypothetical protein